MHKRSILLLLISVAVLLTVGAVMLTSTGEFAQDAHGRPYFFIKNQIKWTLIGLVTCFAVSRVDYHRWLSSWGWVFGVAVVLLVGCFIPPFGTKINGSSRWVHLGFSMFQPSELGKWAAITLLAWWFSREENIEKQFLRGFALPVGFVAVLMGLIVCEVDMGSTALIGATMLAMLFVAGAPLWHIGILVVPGLLGIVGLIRFMPERLGRFMAFLYPERFPADAYQTQQGLIALGAGGLTGLGLGNGRQKLLYLPFAHTDFIFPVIGEELGLIGTLAVIFAYVVFILSGVSIAVKARDRAGLLLGMGLVMIIAIQAAVNLGVTTELLPNKGLPLPFISYGGSNLLFCMAAVGVLINIYRQGVGDQEEEQFEQMGRVLAAERKVVRL